MIKGSIQDDITIVHINAPNIRAAEYMRQILVDIKGEIDSNTIIVGDFKTPFRPMDRSFRQKINMETQTLNDTSIPKIAEEGTLLNSFYEVTITVIPKPD